MASMQTDPRTLAKRAYVRQEMLAWLPSATADRRQEVERAVAVMGEPELLTLEQQLRGRRALDSELSELCSEYDQECSSLQQHLTDAGANQARVQPQQLADINARAQKASSLSLSTCSSEAIVAAEAELLSRLYRLREQELDLRLLAESTFRAEKQSSRNEAQLQQALKQARALQATELACLDEKRGQQQTYANKSASYLTYINATQSKLEASGYTPELEHGALVSYSEALDSRQAQLDVLHKQVSRYSGLQASMVAMEHAVRMRQQEHTALNTQLNKNITVDY